MFKNRKWLSIILIIVIVLALTLVVLSLIPGSRAGRSMLSELIGIKPPTVQVSELHFEVGRNRDFAYSDGSVAAVGTLGLQVLGPDGRETLRDSFRASAPAITENNGRFIAFDIGGTVVRVFNANQMIYSFESESPVVSATINKNGWFCIIVQEQIAGSRGTVFVYNNTGRPIYRVMLGSGFVVSAVLSDNNENLSILNITENGSRVTLYKGIDEDKYLPDEIFELGDEIFFDINSLSDTRCIVFGAQHALIIDSLLSSPVKHLYTYDEGRLGGYTYTDEFVALHLYDYNIGYNGQLITLDLSGNILASLETTSEVSSISSYGDSLVVLCSDGVMFFDKNLEAYPLAESSLSANTTGRILALREDTALNAGDMSAIIVRREERNR